MRERKLHLQNSLQPLFSQKENFSFVVREMQPWLQQWVNAPAGASNCIGTQGQFDDFHQTEEHDLQLGDEDASFHQFCAQTHWNVVPEAFAEQLEGQIVRL